jgi:beta-glucosidase
MTSTAGTLGSDPDERARVVEVQLTDEERFSLLVSVAGSSTVAPSHDTRFPAEVTMCTSYNPGCAAPRRSRVVDERLEQGIVNLDFDPGTRPPPCPPASCSPPASTPSSRVPVVAA